MTKKYLLLLHLLKLVLSKWAFISPKQQVSDFTLIKLTHVLSKCPEHSGQVITARTPITLETSVSIQRLITERLWNL